jgi:electron transport complex protein RnfG
MNASSGSQTVRIYGVVLSVGVVCSLAIVTTYKVTAPIIQQNKIEARGQAILDVLGGATSSTTYRLDDSGQFQETESDAEGADLVFAGFDDSGKLVGLALATQGMGYQDTIRVLYGYSPDQQAIIGIRVLESRETPGLGDRIEKDGSFLENFVQLDVSLASDGTQVANPIEFVKAGEKTSPWQIDGITGATISSRAIAEMLRDSSADWMPRIYPNRSDFQRNQEGG